MHSGRAGIQMDNTLIKVNVDPGKDQWTSSLQHYEPVYSMTAFYFAVFHFSFVEKQYNKFCRGNVGKMVLVTPKE